MKKIFLLAMALVLNCYIALANPDIYDWWKTATVDDVQREIIKNPKYDKKSFLTNAIMYNKNPEIIKLLLKNGTDVNAKGYHGRTPLLYAIQYTSSIDVIRLLIEAGADVNAKDKDGNTALMKASDRLLDFSQIAKVLIESGADVNEKNKKGETAWYLAAKKGRSEIKKILEEAGSETQRTKLVTNRIEETIEETGHLALAVVVVPIVIVGASIYGFAHGRTPMEQAVCMFTMGMSCK